MLAHELRNPLAPIQYSAELLKLDGNPRTSQHADTILRQIGHMRRIVDDLLDVARITRGSIRLKIRRIALRDVITDALAIVKPLIGERRHHLEYVPPPVGVQVQGDEARLAQVFANLLHNAAKFTPPGGHLSIRVATTESAVSVTVQDDGRGIRPSALPHVFDLFDQDETELDRTEGGLGVGLTLVKKLVEMHGGTTSVESAGAGCGSAFTVELPLHGAPDAPPLDEQTGTRTAVSRRVLVVDDNRDAADGLTRLLRLGGHTVRTAYDGQEALDVARAFDPEVVLLDIGLPRIDGMEVARQLKADDSPPTVVAVTGYGKSGELARRAERFDHYLLKPVSLDVIEEILRGSD
jgi:CheY-like chemotaxis protein